MSTRYSTKANLLAGGFLVAGVAMAVITSFVLADVSFSTSREYVVQFSIQDGATGLSEDAPVRVGGQQVGKVRSIAVEPDGAGSYVVNAVVRIRSDIELYEDAWAHLEVPLLGTASTINIPYVGSGENIESLQGGTARLEPGELLVGSIAPPTFLANSGFGPQQRAQLQRMFTSAELAMTELSDAIESLSPRLEPMADDAAAAVASARRTAERVEGDYETWSSRIDSTLTNVEAFTGELDTIADDSKLVLADARELLSSGRAVIDDNRERVDNILSSTDEVLIGVRDEWLPRGTTLFDDASAGVQTFGELGDRAGRLMDEQTPGIERALGNLRIATDQLKFLAIEARSQPWRLLHRPDNKELENQLLYDSARSYAVAVADLRVVSESLESLVARSAIAGEVDLDSLQQMRSKLQEAFVTYTDAESDLLDRMIESNR
jgi:ABC-type transporter Mla subunit MlaD